jgi:hypothetical protein
MKLLKKLALVAALSSVATYASALTPIADTELSKVSGRDGVSIAADLKINIGDFTYTNTSANGGSVSFKNINVNGTFGMTLDVINGATFNAAAFGASGAGTLGIVNPASLLPGDPAAAAAQGAAITGFYGGGDVVKIAIPNIATTHNLNFSVDAISMGGSTASFGKMAMNDIKLQGTTVYIWAH